VTHHRALPQVFDRHVFSFLNAALMVRAVPEKTTAENVSR
jgi:hypothetical protein